eukprot:CAMPEP_0197485238 /NCGR_PEP_ID=MMETSP1311-20131121/232_1 /TAXON_ID=464262 /ORGANISM="Genus nov. species nov., Strain RCC856" /LENGTH=104 /DNA_ID=CAMNT_0043027915 /DNA_START=57 /DNA_END=371 /DNA_ORIENTATION=-
MASAGRFGGGVLRALSQSLKSHTGVTVQKRSVGNLPVRPNSYVEDWAHNRENIELTFKWNAKTLAILGTAGLLTPYLIYNLCVDEFHSMQKMAGKPRQKYMGRD